MGNLSSVAEFRPLDAEIPVEILGARSTGTVWSEEIVPETAEVKGSFEFGPALTRNDHGRGTAWYLGTRLDEETMRTVIDAVSTEAAVTPVVEGLPRGVQAARRGDYLILLDHNTAEFVVCP